MSPVRPIARIRLLRSAFSGAVRVAAAAAGLAACSDPSAPAGVASHPRGPDERADRSRRSRAAAAAQRAGRVRWGTQGRGDGGLGGLGRHHPARADRERCRRARVRDLDAGPGDRDHDRHDHGGGAAGSPVSFSATGRAPVMTAKPVSPTDGQTGVVGTPLALPLRVQVRSEGVLKAGAIVHWIPRAGSVSPAASTTDAEGTAVAEWTLGTVPGNQTVDVTVEGAPSSATVFTARARPGPVAAIAVVGDASPNFPANHAPDQVLVARVEDRYGNGIPGQAVTWTVRQGPVGLVSIDGTTDSERIEHRRDRPRPGRRERPSFAPRWPEAACRPSSPSRSPRQPSTSISAPAVRTRSSAARTAAARRWIPSPRAGPSPGSSASTTTSTPSSRSARRASWGAPSPTRYPSVVTATFTTPGTYHYTDPYVPESAGTLVVQ